MSTRVNELQKSRSIKSLAMKEAFSNLHTIDKYTGYWQGLPRDKALTTMRANAASFQHTTYQ